MLTSTDHGLYCAGGGFYIDPWRPVERALITHAHGDHARPGSREYLCARECVELLRLRLGPDCPITGLAYGETLRIKDIAISFYPAGHVLGAAQIRLEHRGEVWTVSGDYKLEPDPTCAAWGPVSCHTFITESTFGLPIYRWAKPGQVFEEINEWWRGNQEQSRTSVLFGYSLGKAQRLIAGVDSSLGPILAHGAVLKFLPAYAAAGVKLPGVGAATKESVRLAQSKALVIAPPATDGTAWLAGFGDVSTAFASGWMLIRGTRRRRAVDRGFALSDHADWPGLLSAIEATGAQRVFVTHGAAAPLARWLKENGRDAETLATHFMTEAGQEQEEA